MCKENGAARRRLGTTPASLCPPNGCVSGFADLSQPASLQGYDYTPISGVLPFAASRRQVGSAALARSGMNSPPRHASRASHRIQSPGKQNASRAEILAQKGAQSFESNRELFEKLVRNRDDGLVVIRFLKRR